MTPRSCALIVAMAAACGDADPGAAIDAATIDARVAPACAVDLPAMRPVAGDEAARFDGRCQATPPRAYATRGCVLDLSAHRPGDAATCGAEVARGLTPQRAPEHPIELDGATMLPLVIELPRAPGTDAACDLLCRSDGLPSTTVFAVHFELRYVGGGPFHHLRVEPPWRVVSGDEGSATLCDNGRPTIPELLSNCNFTYVKEFALVTDDPLAPAARAIIEADPDTSNEFTGCCAYPR